MQIRPEELLVGTRRLPLPTYFPSVSSVKTALPPADYIQILSSLSALNRQFLVSAFDLACVERPGEVRRILDAARIAGAVTLLDSGNYESYWKDCQGRWERASFHNALRGFSCDLSFSFDEENSTTAGGRVSATIVSEGWAKDQEAAGDCQVVPIVHTKGGHLPSLCAAVAKATGAAMVAVAERRLGDGVIERARAVEAIRNALDHEGRYIALHLLGTGNPISIALYSLMGADSFDGLEWCQTVVDHESALLYHLSQSDFFRGQTQWGEGDLSFHVRTLAHNLEFYTDWMRRLRKALTCGDAIDFCRHNFPRRVYAHCAVALGWE